MACIKKKVTQWMGLYVISDKHPSIMAAITDVHFGSTEPYAYHRIWMHHLASKFMNRFKNKILKNLVCIVALETEKFNKHMDIVRRINLKAQRWLENIPFEKRELSHYRGRRYEIMTINMSEVF